jgi:16S rRNA (cytosine1402-N4)-methyltransferase
MTTAFAPLGAQAQPLGQQERGPLLHPPSLLHPGRNPGAALAEGLRMSLGASFPQGYDAAPGGGEGVRFEHAPVMVSEVLELFAAVPEGVLLDATVGAGGHAKALLAAMPNVRLVGLDRDPEAVAVARQALMGFGTRASVLLARFDRLGEVLAGLGVGRLVGALFDLGVSSPQLDRPERGFSYRFAGPLDMRMGPDARTSAEELVNGAPAERLAALFALHGEERFARRIAGAIVAARPLRTTQELAEVVASGVPAAARRRGHPARRVFQALRAEVNEELEVLPVALDAAIDLLEPGGRIVVISYHSGEDRLTKARLLAAETGGCTCPPGLPCGCGAVRKLRLLARGARKPSPAEVAANHRAQSARLRAAERRPDGLG